MTKLLSGRGTLVVVAVVSVAGVACIKTPTTPMFRQDEQGYPDRQEHSANGSEWCRHLSSVANTRAGRYSFWAWATTIVAAGAVGTGTALSANDQDGEYVTAGGVALAPLAFYFFSESDNSSQAASDAESAMVEETEVRAWETCVRVKAQMMGSRAASNAPGRQAMDATLKEYRKAVAEAKKASEEAKKAAEDAKKIAEEAKKQAEAAGKAVSDAPPAADGADKKTPARN